MNYQDLSDQTIDEKIDELRASLSTIHERVAAEFDCDHATVSLYFQTCVDGTRQYRRRCSRCFQNIGKTVLSHREVAAIASQAIEWDQRLQQAWIDKRTRRTQEMRVSVEREIERLWEEKKTLRKEDYAVYLTTDKWKAKRERVLKRDDYLCQACLIRKATQVHHKTYEHIYNEPLFDLESVCDICHNALHFDEP
jgi:hypothetical protein